MDGEDEVFRSQLKEEPLDDLSREKEDLILPPFNGYSAPGILEVSRKWSLCTPSSPYVSSAYDSDSRATLRAS